MSIVPPHRDEIPIERHAVVGDRRTAATVAADGSVDWYCLPAYDGAAVFGALLDGERGGRCRLGPAATALGRQRYATEQRRSADELGDRDRRAGADGRDGLALGRPG